MGSPKVAPRRTCHWKPAANSMPFGSFCILIIGKFQQKTCKKSININEHISKQIISIPHLEANCHNINASWLVNSQIGDPDPEVDRQGIPVLHPPSHLTMRWSPEKVTLQLAQP